MQPVSNLKASSSGNQPPTKYIVLKSSPGAGPVVTKVVKAPICTSASGINVTVTKTPVNGVGPTQNAAQTDSSPVSTRATVARKAYERCGTADFLRRITGGAVAGKMNISSSQVTKPAASTEVSHAGVNKKPSPPKQINIFSALDDDIFAPPQPKKTSPGAAASAKKPMTTRIELSCTYQPAAKPSQKAPLIVRPAEMANILSPERKSPQQKQQQQNQQQSLLEKLSNKDDWLLEFSGSPTKCPSKPGGSVVDNNSSDEEQSSSANRRARKDDSTERTDSIPGNPSKDQARSFAGGKAVEVVNLDSSCELNEMEGGAKKSVTDRNEDNVEDEDFDIEIEDPKEVEKSSVSSRDSKEKDLSFVEARSRRKRKPPTYFGYEDHELSYNLGLNPVFTPEELEAQAAAKKKRSSSAHSDAHSTTSSNSSGSRGRRGGSVGSRRGRGKQISRSRDDEALSDSDRELADFNEDEDNHDQDKQHRSDFYDEDDEEEEENKSLISSFSSIRSLKSQEKSEDLFADSSSDEELLTSVAQKEKPKPTETIETVDVRSDDTDSSASFSSPVKDKETTEIEQTAFRLYYKENLLKIERKNPHLKTPDEILDKVSELWCKLWKNEREAYLEQARELTQITLPPQLHKGKKGSSERSSERSTRDPSSSRKAQSSSSESHKRRKESKEKSKNSVESVFARLSAEFDSNSSDADSVTTSKDATKESQIDNDSPVKPVSKKKVRKVKVESSTSSSDDDSSSSSSSESSIELNKNDTKNQKKQTQKHSAEDDQKPPKKEVQTPPTPKICFNCPKEAITSHLWCSDGQYCSISCCVLYSKKCFNDWVAERKRKAEIKREQNEIEAYKHAKDFFCIETEDDEINYAEPKIELKNSVESPETLKHETPPFSPSEAKLE